MVIAPLISKNFRDAFSAIDNLTSNRIGRQGDNYD